MAGAESAVAPGSQVKPHRNARGAGRRRRRSGRPAATAVMTNQPLYADRIKVYPRAVSGILAPDQVVGAGRPARRSTTSAPWLRWDRGPGAPDQALLIDMPGRRAYFFGIEIWPQEVYYLTGLLILGAIGLFLVTALVRPRLVRLHLPADGVDRSVHVGGAQDRGRPQRPHPPRQGSAERSRRSRKKVLKHVAWLLIALATGGAWIMYFNDAPTVVREFFTGEAGAARLRLHRAVHRRRPICSPAGRASRSASTCAPGRASRARCSTRTR